jgi:transposase
MPKKIELDISEIKKLCEQGKTVKELREHFGVSDDLIRKYIKQYDLPMNKPPIQKLSEEKRREISEKRKKWLKDNPDKHPWRNKDKFKSKPCEKVKEFLNSLNIQFVEEYVPSIDGRSFSIDIALPDKMIAIEINGNQHYEKDGTLKPYYQERHDLLEANGWIVYEIHYSACFSFDKWEGFVNVLMGSDKKVDFDYFNYVPKEKILKKCLTCGCIVTPKALRCKSCRVSGRKRIDKTVKIKMVEKKEKVNSPSKIKKPKYSYCSCGKIKDNNAKQCKQCCLLNRRVVKDRPTKDELELLVMKYPLIKLSEMFGVSDNAIRKWCKQVDIKCPDNRYRQKMFHLKD